MVSLPQYIKGPHLHGCIGDAIVVLKILLHNFDELLHVRDLGVNLGVGSRDQKVAKDEALSSHNLIIASGEARGKEVALSLSEPRMILISRKSVLKDSAEEGDEME